MGYWSYHPMGGDAPSDAIYVLDDLLFTNKEQEKQLHWNKEEYKNRLAKKLNEAVKLNYNRWGDDCSFVLPFKVAEIGLQIKDEALSRKIKKMIGDGGATQRDYNIPNPSKKEFPCKENNWNDLQVPFDYARKLYDLWDGLMKGKIPFSKIEEDKGLSAAFEVSESGLINKK